MVKIAKRWGFPFLLMLCSAQAALAGISPETLEQQLRQENLVGMVWSTIGSGVDGVGAVGRAHLDGDIPMQADTRVQVGSVTKTVLALGVLRLVTQGQLSLDSPVERLLPTLNWQNPWAEDAPLTVRHLLEHTAGIDNLRLWQFLNTRPTPDMPLAEAFPVEQAGLLQVRTRPGSRYNYSNMGYALLGMVIEATTGRRYEDHLQTALLTPLGMEDSHFQFPTADERLATGYVEQGVPLPPRAMFLRPAGQFVTTAPDMARLMRFLLSDGQLAGEAFIRADLMQELGHPTTTEAAHAGLRNGHGLALASRDRHGALAACHPGTTFGFRAYLCVFPASGKGFFVAFNADLERADYEAFNRLFIEALALPPIEPTPAGDQEGGASGLAGLYVLAPNNMAQFEWLDVLFNSVWVSEEQGQLRLRALQQPNRSLLPVGDGLYRSPDRLRPSHVFYPSEGIHLSDGLKTWRRASPWPVLVHWALLLAGLAGAVTIVARGVILLFGRSASADRPLLLPFFHLLALIVPVIGLVQQDFMRFGEQTWPSLLLALLSGALPLTLAVAQVWLWHREASRWSQLACLALLGLCTVLAIEGLLPLRTWV